MRLARWFVPLLVLLTTSGCCSFARLLCGPDRSEWVPIDYRTPTAATRTLLEALRRDAPQIVYRSLSRRYRRELGLDATTALLAWPRIRADVPGLHLAGYADVPQPTRLDRDHATLVLDVEGHPIRIALVRETEWRLRYQQVATHGADIDVEYGGQLDGLADAVVLAPLGDDEAGYSEDAWWWRASLTPRRFEHQGTADIDLDDVDTFGVFRVWKIDDFEAVEPNEPTARGAQRTAPPRTG